VTAIGFLTGQELVEIRYSLGLVRFVFDAGDRVEPALYADLGPFAVTGADGVAELVDPDDSSTLRPALLLVGKTIEHAAFEDDGSLTLGFSGDASLRCEPSKDFEAWQVVGGTPQHLIVCVEPGEVSVFGETEPRGFG
jgi:hypothetical protein